ncbi:hypothetical protein PVL29_005247 [Vitis rotundifolia]|uniref:Strictosidine synthase conserved region domain-containing protein n=1 Tax=Vitis rotundifolia TaxID=103349 RepID=A0AA39E1M2_VITRO|nr:hypothetical protein PVL29_005247 [Vitis rotundifolia]
MADPTPSQSSMDRRSSSWPLGLLTLILAPVASAMLLYQLDPMTQLLFPSTRSEMIGVGKLLGPEDIAYHPDSHLIYTGCADGWVKRVTLNDSMVQNWAFTGGRPLGVALGRHGQLIVADAEKGLLEVTTDGMVKTLTDEAEGLKFKLTDSVDVAVDGMIYFTDASYKYSLKEYIWDILEGRPHGRLMSFDPSTKETKVLVLDLFFANGVIVPPDQNSVILCEIGNSLAWDLVLKYPWIRKVVAIMERYKVRPHMEKNGGVLVVDLEGNPAAYYYDSGLSEVTSGMKIGNHLYCGSITAPYMIRLDLHQHAAHATM